MKRGRKPRPRPELTRTKVDVPEGYKTVAVPQGQFWNPEEEGVTLEGIITGKTKIKGSDGVEKDRYVFVDADGVAWTLPDHYDLVERLKKIEAEHGGSLEGLTFFIGFEGYEEAKVKSGYMARYAVGVK